jgi:hypothetical protein
LIPCSGRDSGRFLKRGKLSNPETGKHYCASDMKVGALVMVKGITLKLVEADDFTTVRNQI